MDCNILRRRKKAPGVPSGKEATRTDREEFDRFTERDPSTWTRGEVERFHEMESKAFGLDAMTDIPHYHEPDTYSPSSDGVDLQDLAETSEGATMVAHTRPEDDEVRKTGGGWTDNPKIEKPEEDFFRIVYIVSCGLEFESTRTGKQRNGQGATLPMNQMRFQNYLKKKVPHGDPQWIKVPLAQDTDESRDATNTLFETLEWHLMARTKRRTILSGDTRQRTPFAPYWIAGQQIVSRMRLTPAEVFPGQNVSSATASSTNGSR